MAVHVKTWNGQEAAGYQVSIAASSTPDAREAQQAVHDFLIERTGDLRCGPVHWLTYPAHDAPIQIARMQAQGDFNDPEARETCVQVLTFLKEHPTGLMVLGFVPMSERPEDVNGPACSRCGCTDARACEPRCSWVHRDGEAPLCSRCASTNVGTDVA